MKRLIVNADDFGISGKRNAGILEAHRRGIVTSASLIAYAPAFSEAVKLAKACPSLDVGVHLNLSDGEPVVLGHRTLVGPDGKFWGKEEARKRAKEKLFNLAEVERETDAQIDVLQQAGVKVWHLDGHQHIHIYGALPDPIGRAAVRRGVRSFRCPADKLRPPVEITAEKLKRLEEYRASAHRAAEVYAAFKMRSTEHFAGIGLSGYLTLENLISAIKQLPDGLTELMVHPGYADAPSGFTGPEREIELRALTDPRVRILLKQEKVELTTFAKLQGDRVITEIE
jgi:predicted glycoside hydrolase/deacetylase ChbG (UPF0249 family)